VSTTFAGAGCRQWSGAAAGPGRDAGRRCGATRLDLDQGAWTGASLQCREKQEGDPVLKLQVIFLIADPAVRRSPAFERARFLAQSTGATLHICLTGYSRLIAAAALFSRRGGAAARAGFMQERLHLLEQEAGALREQGLKVATQAAWAERATDEILRQIEQVRPDLVIKDAEPEVGLAGLCAGADRILLRRCMAPLLIVHAETAANPRRVAAAVATDRKRRVDTAFNNLIAHTAAMLGGLCGAEMYLLHAEPDLVQPKVPMRHGRPVRGRTAAPLPHSSFEDFAKVHHVPADRCHRLSGAPVEAVTDFISARHIDLLVLGTEPRPLLQRLRRGNKVERINHYAFCDVLALKPARLWRRQAVHARSATVPSTAPGEVPGAR
jgi:universal stress protein E